MPKRGRGRIKGEGRGKGAIQTFIRQNGGRKFIARMYREFRSADAIAEHFFRHYHFYCCGNSVRNILHRYRIRLLSSGGDRRSPTRRTFQQERETTFFKNSQVS